MSSSGVTQCVVGSFSEEFTVPNKSVGLIIGKAGRVTNDIQTRTGTLITVLGKGKGKLEL